MIEVFKTNITKASVARCILRELLEHSPQASISFDLEDCDRVLRVENCTVNPTAIIQILEKNGHKCQLLE